MERFVEFQTEQIKESMPENQKEGEDAKAMTNLHLRKQASVATKNSKEFQSKQARRIAASLREVDLQN